MAKVAFKTASGEVVKFESKGSRKSARSSKRGKSRYNAYVSANIGKYMTRGRSASEAMDLVAADWRKLKGGSSARKPARKSTVRKGSSSRKRGANGRFR